VLTAAEIAAALGVAHLAMGWPPFMSAPTSSSRPGRPGSTPLIDSVYPHLTDDAGLREQAAFARSLGFFGKSAIHPGQLPILHEVFTPTTEEITWAREVIAAFDAAGGEALRQPSGEFVDLPVADRAHRLIHLAASARG
jgi:citrate lyase subunit beta/citryl-CoA lyase